MRTIGSRAAALAALAAGALALAGCNPPSLDEDSAEQKDVIGDVEITTTVLQCTPTTTTCSPKGTGQLAVGYRLPDWADPPQTLQRSGGAFDMSLTRSQSLAAGLQAVLPAPAGQKWVGYQSGAVTIPGGAPQSATFKLRIPLPRAADGSPYEGPFRYRTVIGARTPAPVDLNQAWACGTGLPSLCLADPADPSVLASDVVVPTRDLAVIGGATGSGIPGGAATVPFDMKLAGESGTTFDLAAFTNLPGGVPATESATIAPLAARARAAASTSTVPVSVRIPADAKPGSYDVTLRASLPNGQERSGTGTVVVNPAPPAAANTPATGTLSLARRSLTVSAKGIVTLTLGCKAGGVNCDGTLSLLSRKAYVAAKRRRARKVGLGKARFEVPAGQKRKVRVRVPRKARRLIVRRRRVAAHLTLTLSGQGNAKAVTKRALTLKAPKRKRRR